MTTKELKEKLSTALVNLNQLSVTGIAAAIAVGSAGQLIKECLDAEITPDTEEPK
jgi:hypothetical protein